METYRYNKCDSIMMSIFELYMSSIEFRESFNEELFKYISDIYKEYSISTYHSKESDTLMEYYRIYLVNKEDTIAIFNINELRIHNYISEFDLYKFSKLFLRNMNIDKILNNA